MGQTKDTYIEYENRNSSMAETYNYSYQNAYNAGYAAAMAKIKAERTAEVERIIANCTRRPSNRTGSMIPANVEAANEAVAK